MTRPDISEPLGFDPPLEDWPDAGVYQVRVRIRRGARIVVGRLGRFVFPAGVYVYTGRAPRGLRARVLRYVNGSSRQHWHIDYLLAHRRVHLERVSLASPDPEAECAINQATGVDAVAKVPGFGASECRWGCPAHLWFVSEVPHQAESIELPLPRERNRGQKCGRDEKEMRRGGKDDDQSSSGVIIVMTASASSPGPKCALSVTSSVLPGACKNSTL